MPDQPDDLVPPITRLEWMWLLAALSVALAMRAGMPGRMAIEHFDEGVYASNFWFGPELGGRYPARHLYAPPLLPSIVEWTMVVASLSGMPLTGWVPMLPVLIAGMAAVPSLWWIGRVWFGPFAGLIAAWLCATSDLHSTYSRACLTDVPAALFMAWGVYFGSRAIKDGGRRALSLAIVFTALAWWTKYNGWLPVAIIAAGSLARLTCTRSNAGHWRQEATRGLIFAAGAVLVWSPVLVGLQPHGGYAAVASNHRQYLVGLIGWTDSAFRQLTHIGLYDAWLGTAQVPWLVPLVMGGAVGVGLVLILIGDPVRRGQASVWSLAAWLGGLTLAIPCYQAYPRLVLPWLAAVWLGLGALGQMVLGPHGAGHRPSDGAQRKGLVVGVWRQMLVGALAVSVMTGVFVRMGTGTLRAWEDRTGWSRACDQFSTAAQASALASGYRDGELVTYVVGEPAAVFGLNAAGLLVGPVPDLSFAEQPDRIPTFLVWCERGERSNPLRLDPRRSRFLDVVDAPLRQSSLVILDEHDGIQRLREGDVSVRARLERQR